MLSFSYKFYCKIWAAPYAANMMDIDEKG